MGMVMSDKQKGAKIALVTGAGSGIGRATSVALVADGWSVVLAGRRREPLEEAAAAADPTGERTLVHPADVGDPAAVTALFEATVQRFGRLDLLFNNAGFGHAPTSLEDLPFETWEALVRTNLTGAFLCTQAAFRQMKAQTPHGGRVINNGSISAHAPRARAVAYTTTKHGMTGLTRAAALEGRDHDIACGQIDVGNTETPITAGLARGALQADGRILPEPRMDVSCVADAVVHMASLPLNANVLFMTVLPTKMPYLGRG
jgi:NAD(P)-dependent dehydrogenase (short-subunit alcohol dehydrogenase family)